MPQTSDISHRKASGDTADLTKYQVDPLHYNNCMTMIRLTVIVMLERMVPLFWISSDVSL